MSSLSRKLEQAAKERSIDFIALPADECARLMREGAKLALMYVIYTADLRQDFMLQPVLSPKIVENILKEIYPAGTSDMGWEEFARLFNPEQLEHSTDGKQMPS